ncbi:MAG: LytR C-terminal domain-containing protein [Actinomycetia bacterium]|nr:LytR C-terminal domain-containing protein [Actinomycetes bacterium]
MTSAQRRRRPAPSGPDPASRGFILVIVAVVLGAILLAAGGTVGFDQDDQSVDIGEGGESSDTTAPADDTTTTVPTTVAPADVPVLAANGAGISGLAGDTAAFLAAQGYTNQPTDPTDAIADVSLTVVYYAEGFQPNATAVASLFGLPPEQVQPIPAQPLVDGQPAGVGVIVVVGPDAQGVVSGTGETTTTAAGETTTTVPG